MFCRAFILKIKIKIVHKLKSPPASSTKLGIRKQVSLLYIEHIGSGAIDTNHTEASPWCHFSSPWSGESPSSQTLVTSALSCSELRISLGDWFHGRAGI